MNLTQFAASGSPLENRYQSPLESSPAFSRLHKNIGNESLTRTSLNMAVWNMVLASEEFAAWIGAMIPGLDYGAATTEKILVPLDEHGVHPFRLVVLSDSYTGHDSQVLRYYPTLIDWEVQMNRWKGILRTGISIHRGIHEIERLKSLHDAVDENALSHHAMTEFPFEVIVDSKPEMIRQSIPSPNMGLALQQGSAALSTIGVVAKTRKGRYGFTCALHSVAGIQDYYKQFGSQVWAGSHQGKLVSGDPVSDCMFIESLDAEHIYNSLPIQKPLVNICPRSQETVTFDGITSNRTSGIITGMQQEIPTIAKYNQLKIYTDAITSPGDSGSALWNNDGYILGFAFERTAINAKITYSSWIWAHSVFEALDLDY